MSSVHNEKWVCFLPLCKTLVDLSVLDYKQVCATQQTIPISLDYFLLF